MNVRKGGEERKLDFSGDIRMNILGEVVGSGKWIVGVRREKGVERKSDDWRWGVILMLVRRRRD